MSDLINRKATIDKIREVYEYEFPTASGAFDEFVTVIIPNILRNLPSAESERNWTPVTEALPWNDTNVLVTVCDDSGDTPWEYTSVGWRTPDGQYWVVDNEICYGVIAWMPLPESYKGD